MSSFTRKEVRHVAMLSRLAFSDEEADAFAEQLSEILNYVERLNELDTEGIEPSSHALELTNVMREDVRRASLPREQALANAPEQEEGCFRVPPIIQEL